MITNYYLVCFKYKIIWALSIFFFSFNIFADSWHIKSSRDNFVLKRVNDQYVIGDKSVTKESVNRLLSLLDRKIVGVCPEIRKGPLVVITKNKKTKWDFFLDGLIVRNGDNCLRLNNSWFYSVPLHRIWFTGSNKFSFNIKNHLKIHYAKEKLTLKKKKGWWEIEGREHSLLNHDFLERIEKNLNNIEITGRYHPDIVSSKVPPFSVIVDKKKYKIVSLQDNRWGFIYPRKNWIISSPHLQIFNGFSLKKIFEPNADDFRNIIDINNNLQERVDLMRKYRLKWSPNIIKIYKTILMNREDNDLIRLESSDRLIEHPTDRVLGILFKSLKKSDRREIQVRLVKHLRAIHPKGVAITPDDSDSSVAKKINTWKKWWKSKNKK